MHKGENKHTVSFPPSLPLKLFAKHCFVFFHCMRVSDRNKRWLETGNSVKRRIREGGRSSPTMKRGVILTELGAGPYCGFIPEGRGECKSVGTELIMWVSSQKEKNERSCFGKAKRAGRAATVWVSFRRHFSHLVNMCSGFIKKEKRVCVFLYICERT